jgi:hypothetical protein
MSYLSNLSKLFSRKTYDPPSRSHIDFKRIKGGRVLVIKKTPGKKARFLGNCPTMEIARAKFGEKPKE